MDGVLRAELKQVSSTNIGVSILVLMDGVLRVEPFFLRKFGIF